MYMDEGIDKRKANLIKIKYWLVALSYNTYFSSTAIINIAYDH